MTDRIADIWGTRTPVPRDGQWPVRVDTLLSDGVSESDVDRWVSSACLLCSNGCGIDIAVSDGRMVGVRGRASDVVNHGRLGPKGLHASTRAANSGDRLTRPLVRVDGELVETDWETAMGRIVAESQRLLDEHGPLSHGFYGSGQMMSEEYYAWAVIAKGGIGTPHMDGNTRLCTATAAAAMKESFGSDGQPGSYTDIESCDAIFLFGHNMAETQTVLWSRVLDRIDGPDAPVVVAVDPRTTPVTEAADRTGGVHLAPLPGTNMALMNGLVHELLAHGWIDRAYIDAHTLWFDELAASVRDCTPEWVQSICDVPAADVRRAAEIFGTRERVLSTVLQGFYQSHQATAASCGVHNLHLLRGLIGHPGCGVLQMNGQPTAQNAREAGSDGDMPAFRNYANEKHVDELAALWNVDRETIPHDGPPTHAMGIYDKAEQGEIRLLWIAATNPAVSLPELHRIRDILASDDLFVIVQDGFLTETAQLADVVLPAAMWGERTGTFTNVNRVVHLADKAVEPPGQARADLDIFLDYAHRMDFRDRDGGPLIPWSGPEDVFDAWRECSRGRLCDYTGLSYATLRGSGGIPWPCTADQPDGTDRLFADGVFPTDVDVCETYGHDLVTGEPVTRERYEQIDPDGRAFLRACPYVEPPEIPGGEFPFALTTGRTAYQFHTRTKTARSPVLDRAAPDAWAELAVTDAERLGIAEGDIVRVGTARGAVEVPARIGRGRTGVVFVPFHYGYWDTSGDAPGARQRPRAANETTLSDWDAVSKQPIFKIGAARVERIADGTGPAPAPTTTASAPAGGHRMQPTRGAGTPAERIGVLPPPPSPPTPAHTPNVRPPQAVPRRPEATHDRGRHG